MTPGSRFPRWIGALPLHVVVIGISALWLLPTLGLLVSSFRPSQLVSTSGWWTALLPPFLFTLENYARVLGSYNLGRSFFNSLIITIPATVIPIMVAAYAAYAFAWMRFWGRDVLFTIVVGALVIPLQMTLIPVLKLYTALGLVGTFPAVWLAHTGYGLPFAIYLLRNFIGALPRDLIESAYIDGASALTVFFRLILPLSVPAIASLVIFQFLWVWNDLLVALIYVGGTPQVAPLTVTVSNLVNSLGGNWQLLTAAAFISMALPLVVFLSLQRYFIRGILAGAIKG
jgi:alpha-glucoside transport system permease protein